MLIFAPARHQSATQTAPKAGPKQRAFLRVSRSSHPLGTKAHRRQPSQATHPPLTTPFILPFRFTFSTSPGGGVLFKTKGLRPKAEDLRPKAKSQTGQPGHPPPMARKPTLSTFSLKAYPDVDFYPSFFRVFFTLFDAMLTSIASARGRTKYALFRASRSFSHPLASKARPRPRPKPVRNCARFCVFRALRIRSAPKHTADSPARPATPYHPVARKPTLLTFLPKDNKPTWWRQGIRVRDTSWSHAAASI